MSFQPKSNIWQSASNSLIQASRVRSSESRNLTKWVSSEGDKQSGLELCLRTPVCHRVYSLYRSWPFCPHPQAYLNQHQWLLLWKFTFPPSCWTCPKDAGPCLLIHSVLLQETMSGGSDWLWRSICNGIKVLKTPVLALETQTSQPTALSSPGAAALFLPQFPWTSCSLLLSSKW